MTGKYRLQKTAKRLNFRKEDVRTRVPANLGLTIGGSKVVEIPTRESYHYARIRGNLSEVVQVFNVSTSPVYDLPVLISFRNSRWEVDGIDTGKYTSWGSTAYIPKHGAQHSFDPDNPGGDPVWVWDNQMMPLAPYPSGSSGAGNILIERYPYWSATNQQWQYAGATGTTDLLTYKPTGSSARMVLVYVDVNGNPQLLPGSTFFTASITGSSAVMNYLPDLPSNDDIPVAGIRLVSGTSSILWNNIYGLRPWFTSAGGTGSSGGVTDHGALTGLLDNDHPQYMLTGSVASTTLTRDQIAFGSASNVVTSSPYFHITGAAGYANSYKSVFINFFGGTGSYANYYSLNIGTDDGVNNLLNMGLWGFGGNPSLNMLYGGGTQDEPTTPLEDDTLAVFSFSAYAPDIFSTFYNSAAINLIADEDFDASHLGSHWQFVNVGTGGAGNLNSLLLSAKKATFGGSIQIPSGSAPHPYPSYYHGSEIIDGSWRTTRDGDNLAFQRRESGVWVTKGYPNTGSSAGAQGEPGTPGDNTLLIYDDNTFKITGSAIHFNDGLNVVVTGSSAWIDWTGVAAITDHGNLTGLTDNDHPQYMLTGTAVSGADEKVKISSNDTTAGYLNGKLIEGAGISLTEVNDGSDETLRISYTGTSGGGSPSANVLPIYDDSIYKITGSVISFDTNLSVAVTGSVAFVSGGRVATDVIWDAAGDLVQGIGANSAAKLAIGTANQLLRVNSGATAPEWASVGRVLIASATPTGTNVSFTSIPATFTVLEVEIVARTDKAGVASEVIYMSFNNDTTDANYRWVNSVGNGTTVTSAAGDTRGFGNCTAATASAGEAGYHTIRIPYYAGTTFNKNALCFTRRREAATTQITNMHSQWWESTAAINRIDFDTASSGNFVAGTTFKLYGIN